MNKKNSTVTGIIKHYALNLPSKAAIIVDDNALSYKKLYSKINSAASFFSDIGIKRGSHVLSVAKPDLNYVTCMYALLGIGAVHIPVENNISASRLLEIAIAVDAEYIISHEDPESTSTWIDPVNIDFDRAVRPWDPVDISDDCSEIVFTTGTTGKSKGVMLSSRCLEAYIEAMDPSFRLDEESVFLVTTPLNHVGGMHRIHQCMAAGSTVILMNGIHNLKAFFAAINTYGVTHTYLPPASVKYLITVAKKELTKLDGKLKFIYTASAPFPVSDIEKLIDLLPSTRLHQGYGSSETGSICNCCYNDRNESSNCLGKPYSCVEVQLHDENGNIIEEANKEGFIRSKSKMNMLGYYKEPELTAAVLKDGYVYSSDLMYFDENGGLHFAGRGDDVINVKGYKIAPVEIENCAMKHPSVFDCICIPFEDPYQGLVVKMLVVIEEGYMLDIKEITGYLSRYLETYKVPKYIEEITQIIRTANGKVDRKQMISHFSNI